MKKFAFIFLILIICLCTSCKAKEDKYICTISIVTDEYVILEETETGFAEDATVADVLKKITRQEKIHMEFTGSAATTYINGIDNLYEFDKGPESGWIYFVNDEEVSISCGQYKLQEGDVIRWEYIVE